MHGRVVGYPGEGGEVGLVVDVGLVGEEGGDEGGSVGAAGVGDGFSIGTEGNWTRQGSSSFSCAAIGMLYQQL